jgi:NAD dependent epimerase/dehydratase family enzyme
LRAAVGELAEALLAGQRVLPKKLRELGYEFRHPDLASALDAIV